MRFDWLSFVLGFVAPFVLYVLVLLVGFVIDKMSSSYMFKKSVHCNACGMDITPGFMGFFHFRSRRHKELWCKEIRKHLQDFISGRVDGLQGFYIRAGKKYHVKEWHEAQKIVDREDAARGQVSDE